MKENNFLKIYTELATLQNMYASRLSEEDLLLLKCFLLLLRKENISLQIQNYTLHKKSFVNAFKQGKLSGAPARNRFKIIIENIDNDNIKEFFNNNILPFVDTINDDYLIELINIFTRIEDDFVEENGIELLNYFLIGFYNNNRRDSDSLQPREVSEIINHFVPRDRTINYYNPFGGLASLAIDLPKNVNYLGEEKRIRNQVLGRIRMMIHKCPPDFKFIEGDSIKRFGSSDKYDFIAFNPPFNLKLDEYNFPESSYFSKRNANAFIISECFNKLKKGGKMVFVMSTGFLSSRSTREMRLKKFLVNNDFLESIIALPSNILNFSSISVNIITLSKEEVKKSNIRFIDASEIYKEHSNKQNIIDAEKVIELIDTSDNKDFVRDISYKEIIENDYNLQVSRYVVEDLGLTVNETDSLEKLENLISLVKREKTTESKGKYIKIGDLSSDEFEYTKTFEEIEERELRSDANLLQQDALLVSLAFNDLKPTLYSKKEEDIFYPPTNILACIVNAGKVNIDYLILELHKEYVKNQLKSKRQSAAIQRVSRKDLLGIKIVLPSLEEQVNKVNIYRTSIINKKQQDFKDLVESYGIDVADDNSFLRHQIAGTLKNVRGAFNAIKQIINEQIVLVSPNVLNLKRNEKLDTTLFDYLNILERDLKNINKSVNVVREELDLTDLRVTKFDVLKFLTDYVNEVKNRHSNLFEISINLDEEVLKENQVKEVFIHGDKELLRRIFDNIVENAVKHGFNNIINPNNKIDVFIIYIFEDSEIQVDFTNTGIPLPEDFSYEAYIRKGSKAGENAGDGIGGWLINEVMKLHNGRFGISDETGPEGIGGEDATTIELTFPIELKI
jgi:type I restriction enzyme M protein